MESFEDAVLRLDTFLNKHIESTTRTGPHYVSLGGWLVVKERNIFHITQ